MRKVIFLLLIIIVVFGFNCNVDAAAVNNSCPVGTSTSTSNFTNSSQVCGRFTSSPSFTPTTTTDIVPDIIEWEPHENCSETDYAVTIFVDTSYSMNYSPGSDSKVKLANKAIDAIISAFAKTGESKFIVCQFTGSCKGWDDAADVVGKGNLGKYHISKSDLTGTSTYIQNQLQKAYNKLENKLKNSNMRDKSPYVFIITDGYPTEVSTNGNGIGSINTSDIKALSNSSSSRYFTKTMSTFRDLKAKLANLGGGDGKISVVALMNESDGLVNYFYSPNPNKDALANNNLLIPNKFQGYSEAAYLKKSLENSSNSGFKYYETVAGVESFPDFGLYHGDVNSSGDKVTFEVPISTYSNYIKANADLCFKNRPCKFLFYFKLSNKSYIKHARLFYGKDYNNYIDVTNKIAQHNSLSNFYYFALDNSYTCGSSKCFQKNQIKFVVKLNDGRSFSTSSFNPENTTGIDNLFVNVKNAAALAEEITSKLNPSICPIENVPVVNPGSKKTETTYSYSSNCTSQTISLSGDYWYYSPDVNQTFKVNNLILSYMITEDLTYDFGTMTPDEIYSGGGFEWNGTRFSNKIQWKYTRIDTDSNVPIFSFVYLEGIYNGKPLNDRVKVNEICTNSSCTEHLAGNYFETKINERINQQLKSSSAMQSVIHESFKTIDSNADSFGDSSKVYVEHIINFSGVGGYTPSYELSLRYAYSKDGSNGIIEYRPDSCEESESNCKGQRWYVPLKYPTGEFYVYVKGDFSSLSGITFNVEGTCSINAKQLLYDDPDEPGDPDEPASGLNYRYRSISVDDPFPRGESYIPYNWKKWYSIGNNQTRLSNSLNYTPVYTVTFNRGNSDQITGEDSTYVNWSNINNDGSSKLLNSWKTSGILNSNSVQSYCEKGRFSTECDSNTGGG